MENSFVRDIERFRIKEESTGIVYYGSDQDWYENKWQRMAGCGPSAAANILYYIECNLKRSLAFRKNKNEYLTFMNEMWRFVRPTVGGIYTTGMFCKGVMKYLKEKSLNIRMNQIEIPKNKLRRPDFYYVMTLIKEALNNDTPVAFLNLEHGDVSNLESWHWVTIIALEYEPDGSKAFAKILDGGTVKRIDLSLWHQTTKMGGGFVSFEVNK